MTSQKIYFQHLYKQLLVEIDDINQASTPTDVQQLINRILTLNKPSKRELLLGKLKSNKNFIEHFNALFIEHSESISL